MQIFLEAIGEKSNRPKAENSLMTSIINKIHTKTYTTEQISPNIRFFINPGRIMTYKTYGAVTLLMTMCLSNLAASATPNETILLNHFQTLTANNDIQLGSGYFSNGLYPLHNQCLKEMPIKASNFQSRIALTYSTDLEQLSKNLNININAETGWGKFSSNAAADYVKSIQDDDYSLNFNYQNVITMDTHLDTTDYYGESALNQGGAVAYSMGEDNFIARCGDEYIQNLKMGAVLNVTLRIRFESQLQKKNFETNIKGKIGNIFTASAKIGQVVEQKGIHGTIDVIAFQTGGQPNNLSQIFGADDNHHITSCSLAQLEQCTMAIDDIIAYAQATGVWADSGFSKQIQVVNGALIAESISPVAIADATFGSYENDFGLTIQTKSTSQEVMNARKKLNSLYETMSTHLRFAEAAMQSVAFKFLNNSAQDQIKTLAKTLKGNLTIFNYEKALNCFLPSTQDTCPNIVETITQNMEPVNFSTLNHIRGAYYVNIGRYWPFIFVDNNLGNMDMYDLGLVSPHNTTNDLEVVPNVDFSKIGLRGGYSDYSDQNLTRYYTDFYGEESKISFNNLTNSYLGNPLWKICLNNNKNKCYKQIVFLEILPF